MGFLSVHFFACKGLLLPVDVLLCHHPYPQRVVTFGCLEVRRPSRDQKIHKSTSYFLANSMFSLLCACDCKA